MTIAVQPELVGWVQSLIFFCNFYLFWRAIK